MNRDDVCVISSLVVDVMAGKEEYVASELPKLHEGVEVHEINGSKLVVSIEADGTNSSHEIASSFLNVDGVININLIYYNFEDEIELNKERRTHKKQEAQAKDNGIVDKGE